MAMVIAPSWATLFTLLISILISHLDVSVAVSCDKAWKSIPSMPVSMGEVSAGVVKIGGKQHLCVVGEGASSTPCYSFAKRSWTTKSTRNCVGHHHCTLNINHKLYLLGGLGGCGTAFQAFDGSTWSSLPDLPFRAGSASCGHKNGKITVCGGIDNGSTKSQCATYNFASNSWQTAGSLRKGINHAGYCTVGSKMYVVSGRQGGNVVGPAHDTCQTIDIRSKKTGTCTALPYPVGGVGKCISKSGNLWVFGGELNPDQFAKYGGEFGGKQGGDGGTLNTVMMLDVGSGEWQQKQKMPVAKHGILPVHRGGHVYIVGGGTAAGQSTSKTGHRAKLSDLAACDA